MMIEKVPLFELKLSTQHSCWTNEICSNAVYIFRRPYFLVDFVNTWHESVVEVENRHNLESLAVFVHFIFSVVFFI